MSKPETILTDAEMHALISGNPFTLGLSIARLKDFIRQVEKAVMAKLSEREPVVYLYTGDLYSADGGDINDHIREHGTPLYTHPIPEAKEHHRTAKNHIPDTGKMVFDPDAALTLAERTLSIDITESIAGEIIQFSRKLHEKYAQADHIADANKMVPDGWQLVPKSATDEMQDAACLTSGTSGDRYKAMLAAAPKYK